MTHPTAQDSSGASQYTPHVGDLRTPSGEQIRGLIVPYSQTRLRVSVAAQAIAGLASLFMWLNADSIGARVASARWLLLGVALLLLFNVVRVLRRRGDKRSFIALTPLGLHSLLHGSSAYVAWTSARDIRKSSMSRQPVL